MILTLQKPKGSTPLGDRVFRSALWALREEPVVWPRFGLVGPDCAGTHTDMDYGLLQRGAEPVANYAVAAFHLGWTGEGSTQEFHQLRQQGVTAERHMLIATGGINTHKGSIFLFGLLSYALGQALQRDLALSLADFFAQATRMSHLELVADLTLQRRSFSETYGEWAYRRHGLLGIRGTAINGFGQLHDALHWLANKTRSNIQLLYGQLRLYFLACCEDTNIVKRLGLAGALRIRHHAFEALKAGGMFHVRGLLEIQRLEDRMQRTKCSAAASGDMMILVMFFERLGRHGLLNWQGHPGSTRQEICNKIGLDATSRYHYRGGVHLPGLYEAA